MNECSRAFLIPNADCGGRKFILINSKQNKQSDRETRFLEEENC